MSSEPPCYILVELSGQLVHVDVEYRYADDSALSLLPRSPDEHVLVFDHDPTNATRPTISSTSSQLALSGVKVLPAPGTRADEDAGNKNDNMYIIELTSTSASQSGAEPSQVHPYNPRAVVARFKQRNADLRRILDYPDLHARERPAQSSIQSSSPLH